MNQIDDDKSWLNWLADTDELVAFSPRLRDIASRLGKLDGWETVDNLKHEKQGFNCWVTDGKIIFISAYSEKNMGYGDYGRLDCDNDYFSATHYIKLSEPTIPDEPRPETSAQKHERITGNKAFVGIIESGSGYTFRVAKENYLEFLEADKPDDWPKNKGE
jgi:hypothetical protein